MKAIRWVVAFLAVIAAFAVVTWLAGALILRDALTDPGVRWGVATAAGLAVATLAGLWAYGFAVGADKGEEGTATGAAKTGSGRVSNKISGGTFHGPVIQGRDNKYNADPPQPAQGKRAEEPGE